MVPAGGCVGGTITIMLATLVRLLRVDRTFSYKSFAERLARSLDSLLSPHAHGHSSALSNDPKVAKCRGHIGP